MLANLEYSRPPTLGIAKGSLPGWPSTLPCRRTRGIFHVRSNNGTMGRVLIASRSIVSGWLLSGLTELFKNIRLATQALFSLFISPAFTYQLAWSQTFPSRSSGYHSLPHALFFFFVTAPIAFSSRPTLSTYNVQTILYRVHAPSRSASSLVGASVYRS